jgi:hypothetical protein
MSTKDQLEDNLIATYITGQIFQNYLSCLRKSYDGPDKKQRYLQNTYRSMDKALNVLLDPMHRELKKSSAFEEIEDDVVVYHEVLEALMNMDRQMFEEAISHIKSL